MKDIVKNKTTRAKIALILTPEGVESVSILPSNKEDRKQSSLFLYEINNLISNFEQLIINHSFGVKFDA